jgi:hypothetical protein
MYNDFYNLNKRARIYIYNTNTYFFLDLYNFQFWHNFWCF